MYRTFDNVNGIPPRIYRDPGEIKREMQSISKKIKEIGIKNDIKFFKPSWYIKLTKSGKTISVAIKTNILPTILRIIP